MTAQDARIRDAVSPPRGEPDPDGRRLAVSGAHASSTPARRGSRDGTTLLLCRVEDRRGHSHLCAARSANGVDGWVDRRSSRRCGPIPSTIPEELWGIEDPRITFVDELGKYAVAYTAFSKGGPGVALALTEDFRTLRAARPRHAAGRQGRGAAAAPHRRQLRAHPSADAPTRARTSGSRTRPICATGAATSSMLPARKGAWWDANKVGPVAAAHRDDARLADALSRRAPHGVGLPLSPRRRAVRARQARARACCAATRGSSAPRRPTSARATSATSRSRAATPSAPTATRSTCTTAPPTRSIALATGSIRQLLALARRARRRELARDIARRALARDRIDGHVVRRSVYRHQDNRREEVPWVEHARRRWRSSIRRRATSPRWARCRF